MTAEKQKNSDAWYKYKLAQKTNLEDKNKTLTDEANKVSGSMLNQLFIAAGGIVTLASPPLLDPSSTGKLPHYIRWILIGVMTLGMTSIGFGIAQLYIDREFFRERKHLNAVVIKSISQNNMTPKQLNNALITIAAKEDKSPEWLAWAQFGSSALAAVFYMFCMGYIFISAK